MKEEKEAKQQVTSFKRNSDKSSFLYVQQRRFQDSRERRAAREERERHEMLAQRMHAKKVERLKKRQKRNKMLKS